MFRRSRRRHRNAAPQTSGEAFIISLIKAFGRAIGGRFGRALSGPRRRRTRRWW
jgi:hypothetical protein